MLHYLNTSRYFFSKIYLLPTLLTSRLTYFGILWFEALIVFLLLHFYPKSKKKKSTNPLLQFCRMKRLGSMKNVFRLFKKSLKSKSELPFNVIYPDKLDLLKRIYTFFLTVHLKHFWFIQILKPKSILR